MNVSEKVKMNKGYTNKLKSIEARKQTADQLVYDVTSEMMEFARVLIGDRSKKEIGKLTGMSETYICGVIYNNKRPTLKWLSSLNRLLVDAHDRGEL